MPDRTEKEKMLAGEAYDAGDAELTRERRSAQRLQYAFNALTDIESEEYRGILRRLLPNCHDSIFIRPPFYVDYGSNIYCKERAYFNYDCVLLDVAPIRIGRNCFFAPRVQLLTATHPLDAELRAQDVEFGKPVTIGDDCWMGAGAIILPGVTIGDRCVIGAGSVVTKDIPSDSAVAGNPARLIRNLK